ncbi:MAG: hypothetical protein AMXMBFR36_25580 [Acidobacteriota bacterium]
MSGNERDLLGRKVGHYVLLAPIGEGGMGSVYLAFDEVLHRRVALKRLRGELRLDADAKTRFLREARMLSQLAHPNVCVVHDLVEQDDADSIVLELVDGRDLRRALHDGLDRATRETIALELADVLTAVHASGVVHRDLKPENLMITPEGHLKVLDFGLARSSEEDTWVQPPDADSRVEAAAPASDRVAPDDSSRTRVGTILGTLGYMSPEQARGEQATAASDLYSFGLLLQEIFTGEPAFDRSIAPERMLVAIARGEKRPARGLDPELARLVDELTRLAPDARLDARAALRRLRWIFSAPERKRRRRLVAVWAAAAVLAIAAAAWIAHRAGGEPPLLPAGARGRVALLPFRNDTGDPGLDWLERGLRGMVSETLAGIDALEVVPPERVDRACAQLATTVCGATDEDLVRLTRWIGAEVAVDVRFRADGDHFVADYRTASPSGAAGRRSVAAADAMSAGEALVQRLARRLAPDRAWNGLRERFSEDPFANRLHAMGIAAWGTEGAEAARDFFRTALRVDSDLDLARLALADCADRLSQWDEVEHLAREVRERAAATDDELLVSSSLTRLAAAAVNRLDFDGAEALAREALELARRRGHDEATASALYQLGDVALAREDWAAAERFYEESLAIHRASGDRIAEVSALHATGAALSEQPGRADEAAVRLERAIAIERELGLRPFEAMSSNSLAITRNKQGRIEEARRLFERAIELYSDTGDRRMIAAVRSNLAVLEQGLGRLGAALEQLEGAYRALEELGDDEGRTLVAFNLAFAHSLVGAAEPARRYLEVAKRRYDGDWEVVWIDARLAWLEGDRTLARSLYERARGLAGDAFEPELEARLVESAPLVPPSGS